MRSLRRNKRRIYYANLISETVNTDEYGNETSETTPVYGTPELVEFNVSAAAGTEAVQAFGSFTAYTRTMFTSDNSCPIDEHSIIWFGVEPPATHNYVVVRKADSKNGILYALREVTVS